MPTSRRRNPAKNPQTSTPAFKRWFGASKVVNAKGEPLVVYHSTPAQFDTFDRAYVHGQLGFHFGTLDQADARGGDAGNLMAVYLSLKNPLRVRDEGAWTTEAAIREINKAAGLSIPSGSSDARIVRALQAAGYDGIVYENRFEYVDDFEDSYIVFDPTQVKSATDNAGTFDPEDPSILRNPMRRNPTRKAKPAYSEGALARLEEERDSANAAKAAAWERVQAVVHERVLRQLEKVAPGEAHPKWAVAQYTQDYMRERLPQARRDMPEYAAWEAETEKASLAQREVEDYRRAFYAQNKAQAVKRARAGQKNLADADFAGASLRGVDLSGANLARANFVNAALTGANLAGADLREAIFGGTRFRGARLAGANLVGTDLHGEDLSGVDLSGARLVDAELAGTNLKGANLEGANLEGANLAGADLRGTNFSDANLSGG